MANRIVYILICPGIFNERFLFWSGLSLRGIDDYNLSSSFVNHFNYLLFSGFGEPKFYKFQGPLQQERTLRYHPDIFQSL